MPPVVLQEVPPPLLQSECSAISLSFTHYPIFLSSVLLIFLGFNQDTQSEESNAKTDQEYE